ncbi:unnamed protein product [Rotaria magnacalcarata]|uniref:Midasin n=1 Tax=Rotaria magnacalcarata TaxID=392030 RepID=A0A816D8X5_9BILA|nr:unnamed protein product [Rotaria magnacalcarata]
MINSIFETKTGLLHTKVMKIIQACCHSKYARRSPPENIIAEDLFGLISHILYEPIFMGPKEHITGSTYKFSWSDLRYDEVDLTDEEKVLSKPPARRQRFESRLGHPMVTYLLLGLNIDERKKFSEVVFRALHTKSSKKISLTVPGLENIFSILIKTPDTFMLFLDKVSLEVSSKRSEFLPTLFTALVNFSLKNVECAKSSSEFRKEISIILSLCIIKEPSDAQAKEKFTELLKSFGITGNEEAKNTDHHLEISANLIQQISMTHPQYIPWDFLIDILTKASNANADEITCTLLYDSMCNVDRSRTLIFILEKLCKTQSLNNSERNLVSKLGKMFDTISNFEQYLLSTIQCDNDLKHKVDVMWKSFKQSEGDQFYEFASIIAPMLVKCLMVGQKKGLNIECCIKLLTVIEDIIHFSFDIVPETLCGQTLSCTFALSKLIFNEAEARQFLLTNIIPRIQTEAGFYRFVNSKTFFDDFQMILDAIKISKSNEAVKKLISIILHILTVTNEMKLTKDEYASVTKILTELCEDIEYGTLTREMSMQHLGDFLHMLNHDESYISTCAVKLIAATFDMKPKERELLLKSHGLSARIMKTCSKKDDASLSGLTPFFSIEENKNTSGLSLSSKLEKQHFSQVEQFLEKEIDTTLHNQSTCDSARNQLFNNIQNDFTPQPAPVSDYIPMVMTKTTRENLLTIIEAAKNPIPLLLEGATGVGKSATITEAAYSFGATLVRFNLSSRSTEDDLFGKLNINRYGITMTYQPFTIAFEKGYWILLDEINLAPSQTLQALIASLDTGKITLKDPSQANSVKMIQRHPDFRLFATQNPNSGFFKGKREDLPSSLLSRFVPVIFRKLPDDEWVDVIANRLQNSKSLETKESLRKMAEQIIKFHTKVETLIQGDSSIKQGKQTFPEIGPYAEISIRELLRLTSHIALLMKMNIWKSINTDEGKQLLSSEMWTIYGARFRRKGREVISETMKDMGFVYDLHHNQSTTVTLKIKDDSIDFDSTHSLQRNLIEKSALESDSTQYAVNIFTSFKFEELENKLNIEKLEILTKEAASIHSHIQHTCFDSKFINDNGLCNVQQIWLKQWLQLVFSKITGNDNYEEIFAAYGIVLYALRFRFKQIQEIFCKKINSSFKTNIDIQTAKQKVGDVSALISAAPVFVITRRVEQVWKQMVSAFGVNEPILIVGEVGCGKSETVTALLLLIQKKLFSLTFSPETDPSDLVGQFIPVANNSNNNGNLVDWSNGIVTDAIKHDAGLLLDNLSDADSCVLERLNSLLEQPPVWVLTEKGDTQPMEIPKNFSIIATMSPAGDNASKAAGIGGELSPALSNRFITIFMPSLKQNESGSMNESSNEIHLIAERLLGDAAQDITLAVTLWKELSKFADQHGQSHIFSFRTMIRLFDCTYKLRAHTPELTLKDALYHAFVATIQEQINTTNQLHLKLDEIARKKLGIADNGTLTKPNLSKFFNENESSSEHVLSGNRLQHAETCGKCIISNYPILFEGPPAVGKTSLIVHLGKKLMGTGMRLERVNNSSTTSVQDYIGSLVPFGTNFEFQPGSLVRAMKDGHWFLADELNLADPSVLSVILTVLDRGEIRIPGTGEFIQAHVQFRFFATQNPAGSQFKGRNRLPPILRSRFMEVQIDDFTQDELVNILKKRVEEPLIGVPRLIIRIEPNMRSIIATTMASMYIGLRNNPNLRITMRELIKIERRSSMFSNDPKKWIYAAASLLLPKLSISSTQFQSLTQLLADECKLDLDSLRTKSPMPRIEQQSNGVNFILGEVQIFVLEAKLEQSDLFTDGSSPPLSFRRALVQIAFATQAREPILLIGTTSFKTLLVKTWNQITGRSNILQSVHLTAESDASELIGQMYPYSFFATLHELTSLVKTVLIRSALIVSAKDNNEEKNLNEDWKDLERELSDHISGFQKEIKNFEKQEVLKRNEQRRQKKEHQEAEQEYVTNSTETQFEVESETKPAAAMTNSKFQDDVDISGIGTGEFGETEEDDSNNFMKDYYEPDESNPYGDFGASSDDRELNFNSESSTFENQISTENIALEKNNSNDETLHHQGHFEAVNDQTTENVFDSFIFETERSSMMDSLTDFVHSSVDFEENSEPSNEKELQTLPRELLMAARNLLSALLRIKDFDILEKDEALSQSIKRIKFVWDTISSPSFNRNKPIFLFRDAAVTRAIKLGHPILIEDFDLANQAATERLNSLLEPTPSFSVTEDITCTNTNIDILPGFQLFATVHQGSESEPIKISPAARSRFTEIRVEGYDDVEAKSVLLQELARRLQKNEKSSAEDIDEKLDLLHETLIKAVDSSVRHEHSHYDLTRFLRVVDCLSSPTTGLDLNERLLVAIRFFLLDGVTTGKAIAHSWITSWGLSDKELNKMKQNVDSIFGEPTLDHVSKFIQISNKTIKSAYCDICMPLRDDENENDVLSRLRISSTRTTCKNIARLFTADSARVPLLLEGPPGIGKTAIIDQVCKLRNEKLERINMSANTTVEQLFGSIVAKSDGHQRAFVWQDGVVTRAVRKNQSILFDEINLAPPEVLESIVPLLERDTKRLALIGSTEVLEDINSRIYATMNPANIGGGRTRLPRSIVRMFTSVKLDPYDDIELKLIVETVFSDLLPENRNSQTTPAGDWPILTHSQLDKVFELHKEIHKLVSSRDIGQTGGPHEINLRDLIKLCDVLRKNARDLRDHYTYFPNTSSSSGKEIDVRLIIIRKFFRLVYGMRWQDVNDRLKVDELIDNYLPISERKENEPNNASSLTIDTSSVGFIRVGSLYVRTSHTEETDSGKGLVHTPRTMEYLEMLVAAMQSKRATMLVGPTSSGKSALLYELARICRRKLIVLHLTQETETADLIGQWVPRVCEETSQLLEDFPAIIHVDNFIKRLTKFLLIYVCPILKRENSEVERETKLLLPKLVSNWLDIRTQFQLYFTSLSDSSKSDLETAKEENDHNSENQSAVSKTIDSSTENPTTTLHDTNTDGKLLSHIEKCMSHLKFIEDKLSKQMVYLERQKSLCSDTNVLLQDCKNLIRLIKIYHKDQSVQQRQKPINTTTGHSKVDITFKFIESQLVQAIREGHWIVLDNINSAPPEVLERLLSLFEENPVLNLYENNTTEDGSDATEELSGDKIHPDFALFSTYNPKLEGANKLSTALTNRVLCISVAALDNDVEYDMKMDKTNGGNKVNKFDPKKTNIYKILLDQFIGVHGGYELVSYCLLCHADAKVMLQNEEIHTIKGFQYSFRTLQNTCSTARYLMGKYNIAPLHAVIWGLLRNYTMCITNLEEKTKIIIAFKKNLHLPFFVKNTFNFVKQITHGSKSQLDLEIDELTDMVSDAETFICDSMCILAIKLVEFQISTNDVGDFILGFVNKVLLYQRPYLKQELDKICKLIDSTGPLSNEARKEILSEKTSEILCGDITDKRIEMLSIEIERCGNKLYTKLYKFIQCLSVFDLEKQAKLLKRIINIFQIFENLFENIEFPPWNTSFTQKLWYKTQILIRKIRSLNVVLPAIQTINRTSLIQLYDLLQQLFDTLEQRSGGFAIQNALKKPLITIVTNLEGIRLKIKDSHRKFSQSDNADMYQLIQQTLDQFLIVAGWCALMWKSNVITLEQQANVYCVDAKKGLLTIALLRVWDMKLAMWECLPEAIEKLERAAFAIGSDDAIRYEECTRSIKSIGNVLQTECLKNIQRQSMLKQIESHRKCCEWLQNLIYDSSTGHFISLEYALSENFNIFLENFEANEIDSPLSLIWLGLFFTSIAKKGNDQAFIDWVLEKDDGLDLTFCIDTESMESNITLSITQFNKSKKEANQVVLLHNVDDSPLLLNILSAPFKAVGASISQHEFQLPILGQDLLSDQTKVFKEKISLMLTALASFDWNSHAFNVQTITLQQTHQYKKEMEILLADLLSKISFAVKYSSSKNNALIAHELLQTLNNTINNLRKTQRGEMNNNALKIISSEIDKKAKTFKQATSVRSEIINEITNHWKTSLLDRKLLKRVLQLPMEVSNTIPFVFKEIQNIAQTQEGEMDKKLEAQIQLIDSINHLVTVFVNKACLIAMKNDSLDKHCQAQTEFFSQVIVGICHNWCIELKITNDGNLQLYIKEAGTLDESSFYKMNDVIDQVKDILKIDDSEINYTNIRTAINDAIEICQNDLKPEDKSDPNICKEIQQSTADAFENILLKKLRVAKKLLEKILIEARQIRPYPILMIEPALQNLSNIEHWMEVLRNEKKLSNTEEREISILIDGVGSTEEKIKILKSHGKTKLTQLYKIVRRVEDCAQDMNLCQSIEKLHSSNQDNDIDESTIKKLEASCQKLRGLFELSNEIKILGKTDTLTKLIDESYADWGWWQLLNISVLWLHSKAHENLEQSQSKKLYAVAATLNDKVAMEFYQRNIISEQQTTFNANEINKLFEIIVYEHSNHVIQLGSQLRKNFNEKLTMTTWDAINTVCQPIAKNNIEKELNFVNLFRFVEILHIRKSDLDSITSSFPWHASYILQPRLLRCSDLMTWLCPEYLNAISGIVMNEINAEMFIQDLETPKPNLTFDPRSDLYEPRFNEPTSKWQKNACSIRKTIENLTSTKFILSSNQVKSVADFLLNLLLETITVPNESGTKKPPFLSLQQNIPLEIMLGLSMANIAIYFYENTVHMESKKEFLQLPRETLRKLNEELFKELNNIEEEEKEMQTNLGSIDLQIKDTRAKIKIAQDLIAVGAPNAEDNLAEQQKQLDDLIKLKALNNEKSKQIIKKKEESKDNISKREKQHCQDIQQEIINVMDQINTEVKNIIKDISKSISLDLSPSENNFNQILSNLLNLFKKIHFSSINTTNWSFIINEKFKKLSSLYSETETILQKLVDNDPLRILIDWTLSSILEGLTCSATNIKVYDQWQKNVQNERLCKGVDVCRQIKKSLNETIKNTTTTTFNVSIVSDLLSKSINLYKEFENKKDIISDPNCTDDILQRLVQMIQRFIFQCVACLTTLAKFYGITLKDEQEQISDYAKQILLSANRSQYKWVDSGKEADLLATIDRLRHQLPQVQAALSSVFISKTTGSLLSPLSLTSDLDQCLFDIGDTVLPSAYLLKTFSEKCLLPFVGRDTSKIGKVYSKDIIILIDETIGTTSKIAEIEMSVSKADAAANVNQHIGILSQFIQTGKMLDLDGRRVCPELPWNVLNRASDIVGREILKSATAATAKAFSATISQAVASSKIIASYVQSNENTSGQQISERDTNGSCKLRYTLLRLCDFARRSDYLKQLLCRENDLSDLGSEPNLQFEFERLHEAAVILDKTVKTTGSLLVDLMDCLTEPESLHCITNSFKKFVEEVTTDMTRELGNEEQANQLLLNAIQRARNFESSSIMNEIEKSQWMKMGKYLEDVKQMRTQVEEFHNQSQKWIQISEEEVKKMIEWRDEARKSFWKKWLDKIKKAYQEFVDKEIKREAEHGKKYREWQKECKVKSDEIVTLVKKLQWLKGYSEKSDVNKLITLLYDKNEMVKNIFQEIVTEHRKVSVKMASACCKDYILSSKKIKLEYSEGQQKEVILSHTMTEPLYVVIPIDQLHHPISIEVDSDSCALSLPSTQTKKLSKTLLNNRLTLDIEITIEYLLKSIPNTIQTHAPGIDDANTMIRDLLKKLEELKHYLNNPEKDPGLFRRKEYNGEKPEDVKDTTDDDKRKDDSCKLDHPMIKALRMLTNLWHKNKKLLHEIYRNLETSAGAKNIKTIDLNRFADLKHIYECIENSVGQIKINAKKVIDNAKDMVIEENLKDPISQLYTNEMVSIFNEMKSRDSELQNEIRSLRTISYMLFEHVKILRIINMKTCDELMQIQMMKNNFPFMNVYNADKIVENRIQIQLLERATDKLFKRKHELMMRLRKCCSYLTVYQPPTFDTLPAINNIDSDAFETIVFVNKKNNSWHMEPKELSADFGTRFISTRRNKRLVRNFLMVNADSIPITVKCTGETRENLSFIPPSFDILPGGSRFFSAVFTISTKECRMMTTGIIAVKPRVGNDPPKPIGNLKVIGIVESSKVELSEKTIEFGDLACGSGVHIQILTIKNNSNVTTTIRLGVKCLREFLSGLEVSPTELLISSKSTSRVSIILRCADKVDEVKAELIAVSDGADPQKLPIAASIQEPEFKIYLPFSNDHWESGDDINLDVPLNEARLVTFAIENLSNIDLHAITDISKETKYWMNIIDDIVTIKKKGRADIRLWIYGKEEKSSRNFLKLLIGSNEMKLKIFITCGKTDMITNLRTDMEYLIADFDWLQQEKLLENNRLLPINSTLELHNRGRITSMAQVNLIESSSNFKMIEQSNSSVNNNDKTVDVQLRHNMKKSLSILSHLYRFENSKIKCNIQTQDGTTKTIECNINIKQGRLVCRDCWKDFGNMVSNQQYVFETKLTAKGDTVHLLVNYLPTLHSALKPIIVMINEKRIRPATDIHIHRSLDEFIKENEGQKILIPPESSVTLKVITELKDSTQAANETANFLHEIQVISLGELLVGPDQIVYRYRPLCFLIAGTISASQTNTTYSDVKIETLNELFTSIVSISWAILEGALDVYRSSIKETERTKALQEIDKILKHSFHNKPIPSEPDVVKLIDEIRKSITGAKLAHHFIQKIIYTWNIHPSLTLPLSQDAIEDSLGIAAACLSTQLIKSDQQELKFIDILSVLRVATKFNLSSELSFDQMITIFDAALRPSSKLFETFSNFLSYGSKILTVAADKDLDYIVQQWPWRTNILKQTAIPVSRTISTLFFDQNKNKHENVENAIEDSLASFFNIFIQQLEPDLSLLWNSCLNLDTVGTISTSASLAIICNMIPENSQMKQEASLLADIAKTLLNYRAFPEQSFKKLTKYSINLLNCQTDEIRAVWQDKKPRWENCIIKLIEYIFGSHSVVKSLLKKTYRLPVDEEELENDIRRGVGHHIEDAYIKNTAKELFVLKESLRNENSSRILNNTSSFIAHCRKIGLIPSLERTIYINRALIAVEKLRNYSQTYDNTAIDTWSELIILCGCISSEWRKSSVWYASEALFQFAKCPSIENVLNIFIQGLSHIARENNCTRFIDRFQSIVSFSQKDYKGKLETIFSALGWSPHEIINARNEYEFLQSLTKTRCDHISKVAKSMLCLWKNYKNLSTVTSTSERFQSVFFTIIEAAIHEGHQISEQDLKQLIHAISLYANEPNNQLLNAIRSPSLILTTVNLHRNLSEDRHMQSSPNQDTPVSCKPKFDRQHSIILDGEKLPKYKPSFSFENEIYDNPNQWLKHMIKHDEVQPNAMETISTITCSTNENQNNSPDPAGYVRRYENAEKDAKEVSDILEQVKTHFPNLSIDKHLTEEQLLNTLIRLSQIILKWSRSFTNTCSLIQNDKQINDKNNKLAFQIIIDGINLLRYLLGLETNLAVFVNDPLTRFVQEQIKILKTKLSSLPIHMLSEELSVIFHDLHLFKQKTDDDDDADLDLVGNIFKKSDEKNLKTASDFDDPFEHLKHGEQEKIFENIENEYKEKDKLPPPPLDSFLPNEPPEDNTSDNEEKPKIFVPKIVVPKKPNKPKPVVPPIPDDPEPPSNPKPNPPPAPKSPDPKSNPLPASKSLNPNDPTEVDVDAIAAANCTVSSKDLPNLIPTKEKIREMLNNANIYDIYQAGSYHEKQKNPMAVYNKKLEDLLNSQSNTWSYQKLASCQSINVLIDTICAQVRNNLSDLFNQFPKPITFEWVIMIDNSGSMSIYENYIQEAIIIILETLRKLECRVAVGRFGNRSEGSQVILKPFDRPLTFRVGQMILEGLTFCESSHISTGVAAIAAHSWGHSDTTSTNNVKRIALVITDALSTEIREDKDQFAETKAAFNFSLALLHVRSKNLGDKMKGLESSLKQVSDGLCLSIDPSDPSLNSLSKPTSSLLISAFQKMINSIHNSSTSTSTQTTNNNQNFNNEGKSIFFCFKNEKADCMWPVEKLLKPTTYEDALKGDGSGSIATSLCYVSSPTNTLPYEEDAINSMQQDNKRKEIENNQKIRLESMEKAQ